MSELQQQIEQTVQNAFKTEADVIPLYHRAILLDLNSANPPVVNWDEINSMIDRRWSSNKLLSIQREAWKLINAHHTRPRAVEKKEPPKKAAAKPKARKKAIK